MKMKYEQFFSQKKNLLFVWFKSYMNIFTNYI